MEDRPTYRCPHDIALMEDMENPKGWVRCPCCGFCMPTLAHLEKTLPPKIEINHVKRRKV